MEAERIPLTHLDFTKMRKTGAAASHAAEAGKGDSTALIRDSDGDSVTSDAAPGAARRGHTGRKRSTPLATNVDDSIEVLGTGWFHIIAVIICGVGNAADAVELLCIGYIIPALEDQGEVPNPEGDDWKFQKSFLSAAVFAGMLVGGVLAGIGADAFGRKPMLMASLGINALFGVVSAFTPAGLWPMLAACRIMAGVGVGGSIPSVFTLYSEYLPVKGRGFWLSIVAWFWMVGSIYAAGIAWILISLAGTDWRVFAAACAAPAFVAFVASGFLLPESPRYLATKGRLNDARDVLLWMARWNKLLDSPRFVLGRGGYLTRAGCKPSDPVTLPAAQLPRGSAAAGAYTAAADSTDLTSMADIGAASSPHAAASGADDGAAAGRLERSDSRASSVFATDAEAGPGDADYEGYTADAPRDAAGDTRPKGCAGCLRGARKGLSDFLHPSIRRTSLLLVVCWFTLSFGWYGLILWIPTLFKQQSFELDAYQDAFLVAAANLPGNIIAAFLMDRIGRRFLLGGGMMLAAILAVIFAFSHSAALTVTVACLLNMVSVGGWNSLDCLSTESFPTTLRTTAMGYLAGMGRLGSIIAQFVFGALIDKSTVALLCTAAGMLFIGAMAGLALPQETSGEQLADSLESEAKRLASGPTGDLEMRATDEPVIGGSGDRWAALSQAGDHDDSDDGSSDEERRDEEIASGSGGSSPDVRGAAI